MGTKNVPGAFDCYAKAEPDEPMFTLLARDPTAPALVRIWVAMSRAAGRTGEKIAEAEACAVAMEVWAAERIAAGVHTGPTVDVDVRLELQLRCGDCRARSRSGQTPVACEAHRATGPHL